MRHETTETRAQRGEVVSEEESDEETQSTESLNGERAREQRETEAKWWKRVILGLPRMKLRSETLP
jgi:hypothetical protein